MPSSAPPIWLLRFGHWYQSRPVLLASLGVASLAMLACALLTQLLAAPFDTPHAAGAWAIEGSAHGAATRFSSTTLAAMLACALVAGTLAGIMHRLLRDLTAARSELLALTTHDATTQALNSRYFLRRAQQVVDRAGRDVKDLCVVLVRVEQFDALSVRYGRTFIDDMLRAIGGACLRQLRAHDLFARHGDDEFVGLLQASHPNLADIALARLRRAVDVLQHVDAQGTTVPVTVSFGVSQIDYDADSLEKALARITQRGNALQAGDGTTQGRTASLSADAIDGAFRSGKAPA